MNTQGVAVERGYARPVMSGIHAMYSVGVLAGAGVGALAASADVDPLVHFAVAAAAAGAGMAIGRFGGDAVIARFGRPATLWWSSLVAGTG